jgi:predicted TIM-barrel fold metal-dependent hydrolase
MNEQKPHRIDVHHHILPPRWLAEERERMASTIPMDFDRLAQWTPSMSVDAMDRQGIATAVTSVSTVVVRPSDPKGAHDLARACNEYGSQLTRDFPGRFGVFALLPFPHVDESLREIEYACDVLKVDGFKLQTSYNNIYPGDPAFAPVFDELNRRKATVFFHPTVASCCIGLLPHLNAPIVEYPFDTTRAILSIVMDGTMTRCPNVNFIFSHGGGTLPMLAHRIARLVPQNKDLAARLPEGFLKAANKLYYDVVSTTNPPSFSALTKLVSVSQLLFGTDVPYIRAEATVTGLHDMGLTDSDLSAIERDNALRLMPSLQRRQSC